MFLGARVSYIIADQARLGVITELGEDRHAVTLDAGNTIPASPDRLRLVKYWKIHNREIDVDKLRFYPNNTDALEIFRDTRGVTFDIPALRSMWYWANTHVFHKKLREPIFVVSANKTVYGRFIYRRGKKQNRLIASTRNHNLQELFATTLHEMIHQYNFEIDLKAGDFQPRYEGTHGAVFLNWLPVIREKTGVVITVTANPADDVTIFEDTTEEPTTKPFIFSLVKRGDAWFGFLLKDLTDLTIFTGEVSSLLMRQTGSDTNVYAGISKLRRVQQEFQAVRGGQINWRAVKSTPSLAVVKLAVKTAQPIDGWRLPKIAD